MKRLEKIDFNMSDNEIYGINTVTFRIQPKQTDPAYFKITQKNSIVDMAETVWTMMSVNRVNICVMLKLREYNLMLSIIADAVLK